MKPWKWKHISCIALGSVVSLESCQPHRIVGIHHDQLLYRNSEDGHVVRTELTLMAEPLVDRKKTRHIGQLVWIDRPTVPIKGYLSTNRTVLHLDRGTGLSKHVPFSSIKLGDEIDNRGQILKAIKPFKSWAQEYGGEPQPFQGWEFRDEQGKLLRLDDDGWQDYSWLPTCEEVYLPSLNEMCKVALEFDKQFHDDRNPK